MLKRGIHPKIVQERLGHSSIEVTLDTYSHVAPGLQEAAAAKFDEGLLPRQKSEAAKDALKNPD
jgi:integrase